MNNIEEILNHSQKQSKLAILIDVASGLCTNMGSKYRMLCPFSCPIFGLCQKSNFMLPFEKKIYFAKKMIRKIIAGNT